MQQPDLPRRAWSRRPALQASDARYCAELAGDRAAPVVTMRGTVSVRDPSPVLRPFIEAVHGQLTTTGVQKVDVDWRELEFCNSSGFKAFIYWIELIRRLPEQHQYRLRFLTDPTRRWQRTSLLALTCHAVSLTEIAS